MAKSNPVNLGKCSDHPRESAVAKSTDNRTGAVKRYCRSCFNKLTENGQRFMESLRMVNVSALRQKEAIPEPKKMLRKPYKG